MFAAETKALIRNIGLQENLISNPNLNDKIELLTLVKVSKGRIWQFPKYQTVMWTLPDLVGEEEFFPEAKEEVLVEDFITSVETNGSSKVGGEEKMGVEAAISASTDSLDSLLQAVNINKIKVDLKKLRQRFSGRAIKQETMKLLKLREKDKLTFVYETIYNTGPVKLIRKAQHDGSMSASCQKVLNFLFKGKWKEETSFTVPEKSTFAYGLIEILFEDQKMEISLQPWTHKRSGIAPLSDNNSCEKLQEAEKAPLSDNNSCEKLQEAEKAPLSDNNSCEKLQEAEKVKLCLEINEKLQWVREEVLMKEPLLKPLADLPKVTCHDLLKHLQEVLEVPHGLAVLEELLHQSSKGSYESSESQVLLTVMEFIDAIDGPSAWGAVQLLVDAMDALLDGMAQALISCDTETLKVLSQMVDSLKKDEEVKIPETLPAPLQEDGALRWGVELLCATNETLEGLSHACDRPPEVLVEVLALTVLGLSLLTKMN